MNLTERAGELGPQDEGTHTLDKIPPIEPCESYRILRQEEVLAKGDELWSVIDKEWKASDAIGNVIQHNAFFTYRRRLGQADLVPNLAVDEFFKRCNDAKDLWLTADQRKVYDPDETLDKLRSEAIALKLNTKSHERIFPEDRNKLSIIVDDWADDPRLEAAAWNRFQDQISDLVQAAKELKSYVDVANEPIFNPPPPEVIP